MAQIRVEKRPKLSMIWLVVAVLALVLLFWGLSAALAPDRTGDVTVGQESSLVVPYAGREWVPADTAQATRLDDNQMRVVDTVNGVNLYAAKAPAGGGGGGGAANERLYVRMADGRYVPMVRRTQAK